MHANGSPPDAASRRAERRRGTRQFVPFVLDLAALFLLAFCSCKDGADPVAEPAPRAARATIKVTSPAFQEGQMIPPQYTCDGADISPPLNWEAVPAGARSLALIVDDPDAPGGTFVHWVLYDLPADRKGLPENFSGTKGFPPGGQEGLNSAKKTGYGGPCPPSGTHRYFFKLYALDAKLNLPAGATKEKLLKAMEGHILAQGQLMGRYQRQ